MTSTRGRRRVGIASLVAALGFASMIFVGGEVGAAGKTRRLAGTFDFRVGASPACPDPTCAIALFKGVIRGPAEGPATAIFPAQPPTNLIAEGLLTVHTSSGDLNLAGTTVFNPDPASDGEITFHFKIVGGTGAYAGAGGYIIAAGESAVPGVEVANLRYSGKLTLP